MTRQQCGALRCTLLLEVFLIFERSQELNESKMLELGHEKKM